MGKPCPPIVKEAIDKYICFLLSADGASGLKHTDV
jgi:hypothetical protein